MQSAITNISNLLSESKELKAVPFADGYSFDKDKASAFFDNLISNLNSPTPIFSGILILSKNGLSYTIIDGLQRITTVCLLLCALCEYYRGSSEVNDEAAAKIRSRFLMYNNEIKLEIGKNSNIYEKIVLAAPLDRIQEKNNIAIVFKTFLKKLNEKKILGNDLFKIISKMQFMIIETEKSDISPREMYQAINTSVSQLNLIDDFILSQNKGFFNTWRYITDKFPTRADAENFVSAFLTTRLDCGISDNANLYNKFKNYYYQISKFQTIDEMMENIKKYATYYLKIENNDFSNPDVSGQIKLLQVGSNNVYPYLMEVLDDVENSNINESSFLNILKMLNMFIKSQDENNIKIDFSNLSRDLNRMLILNDSIEDESEIFS